MKACSCQLPPRIHTCVHRISQHEMAKLRDWQRLMYNLFVASNQELSCQAAPTSGSSKYTYRSLQLYSSSLNSARPALELRYSFLHLSAPPIPQSLQTLDSPLNRPLHCGVSGNKRGNKVQDLVPRAAHDVPEALADESRHGALSVGAERVGDYALAGSATALIGVAPGANVPSASRQRTA